MDPLIMPATGDAIEPVAGPPKHPVATCSHNWLVRNLWGLFSDGQALSYGRVMSTPVIAVALGAVSYLTVVTGKLPERMGDLAIFATSLVGVLYGTNKVVELAAKKAEVSADTMAKAEAVKASAMVKAESVKADAVVEAEKLRTNGNGNGGKRPPPE